MVLLHLVQALPVMRVHLSLSNRRIIVHAGDAGDQLVTEFHRTNLDSPFLRPPDILAAFLRKLLPPLLKNGDTRGGHAFRLGRKRKFWGGTRHFLAEGEDIRAQLARFLFF
ncbi:MAG TPA: hypothetical protein VFI38_05085 [Candidatus Acidoferrum sp.]|nr:hypothetical protein [Candidatus Acidoferrum sp.]